MTLGQRIREARIERGLTQKQLVGEHITRNMLSKIENDSATPSVRTLEYLAARLELPPGYLMQDSRYSDGTSPDGLDDMRAAYREGRYKDCIDLLESAKTAGTTDEGYLLRARASLAAAREAMAAGDFTGAKEFADAADYYNKEGIYYSAEVDAEMSLILAECALSLDISEFEYNMCEFERAAKDISFTYRCELAKAEFLLKTGERELAQKQLEAAEPMTGRLETRRLYLLGMCLLEGGDAAGAVRSLSAAESAGDGGGILRTRIFEGLESGYLELQDFKMAHAYASKQIRE